MKESCGVFGVYAPGKAVAQLTFDGLYALQHRGQESAGMAVSDGEAVTVVRDMGLVTTVFDERTVSCLPGDLAIGHTRYSTTGASEWRNAQPVYRAVGSSGFALGHNGNLTNTAGLAEAAGMLPGVVASDSDLVAELLALRHPSDGVLGGGGHVGEGTSIGDRIGIGDDPGLGEPYVDAPSATHEPDATGDVPDDALELALRDVLPKVEGAFSFVLLDAHHLFGVRDPAGLRPLCLGRLGPPGAPEGWVLASETPALDIVGATFVRELEPGELVVIDDGGVRSEFLFPEERVDPHLCIFEFVYFARPDSRLYGREVHGARRRMGELLAAQAPVDADLVMGVPESGVPAAEGYARASGIPHGQGLVKNRYIGRTFITPGQEARSAGVRRKLNPLRENIVGRRIVVVDDSIVRGTTQRAVVRMLREAGAREVHLRISSPPLQWPCFYGIDIPDREQLIAATSTIAEMEAFLGVDSLEYLSLDNLIAAIDAPGAGFCAACLTGEYPVPVPVSLGAARAEAATASATA
ncbi:MAG TPA: amidophosphoribosyltransferase [Acidimicrobiales bacterium]|nr:amidophosphoribosyltransferase [Acidimicrobiales bacterium]